MRNEIGRLVPYADTDASCRMRREIERINEFLRPLIIDLHAPGVTRTERHLIITGKEELQHILITPPGLYRVFNRGSFQLGGRAYAWWQSLPSRTLPLRQHLRINGEPVVEPDYDAIHARIVYALHDRELDGDPYETGEFPREEGKLAFLIAINAPTTNSAIGAIADAVEIERQRAAKLLKAIKARHREVDGAFGADIGVKLMRIDSDIALRAVKDSVKADIPALPVHDTPSLPRPGMAAG
jgi:hypothetical protein